MKEKNVTAVSLDHEFVCHRLDPKKKPQKTFMGNDRVKESVAPEPTRPDQTSQTLD